MLDAYTAIEDYHYGDQPLYGCQHIFVGVEEYDIKSFITTEELNKKWNMNIENEDKEFINDVIDSTLNDLKSKNIDFTRNIVIDSEFFNKYVEKSDLYVVVFIPKFDKIVINSKSNILLNKSELFNFAKDQIGNTKMFSTRKENHFLIHEQMHRYFYKNYRQIYLQNEYEKKIGKKIFRDNDIKIIREKLSIRAVSDKNEFMTEYKTLELVNNYIPKEIEKIYKQILNGTYVVE